MLYSAVFLASTYAVYSRDAPVAGALVGAWVVFVVARPLERLTEAAVFSKAKDSQIGHVVGTKFPGLIEVLLSPASSLSANDVVTVGEQKGIVIDISSRGEGHWALVSLSSEVLPAQGSTIALDPVSGEAATVGVVNPGSEIGHVLFRTPAAAGQLVEGSLVKVRLRGEPVLYQVVAADIKRERLGPDAEHRFVEVTARKIGRWDASEGRFRQVPWLPAAGAAVELEAVTESVFDDACIGCVPSSSYGVRVDLDPLITHNAAILGILGVGKTYLAFEIVRRALVAGKRVIVIDITGEYSTEFKALYSDAQAEGIYQAIADQIAPHHDAVSVNVQEGGNINDFKTAIGAELAAFLTSEEQLRVYNPNRFDVTKQDSRIFCG